MTKCWDGWLVGELVGRFPAAQRRLVPKIAWRRLIDLVRIGR